MHVAIVGLGRVGTTLAYTLLMRQVAERLSLVHRRREIAEGEALDLGHAGAFIDHSVSVSASSAEELTGCDLIVLACSVPSQSSFTSRFDFAPGNRRLFDGLIPVLAANNPDACVMVVTNPVDVMTWHALELTGWPRHRIFGTGTLIDSARFRMLLSAEVGIHPDDLRAYMLGEHGDTQFPVFSTAIAGGKPIVQDAQTQAVCERTRRAGWEVVSRKGSTSYAIAMAAALVIEAMAWDTRRTVPLSVRIEGWHGVEGVCLSVPVVMGRRGIVRVLEPQFNRDELAAFLRCADVVREAIANARRSCDGAAP